MNFTPGANEVSVEPARYANNSNDAVSDGSKNAHVSIPVKTVETVGVSASATITVLFDALPREKQTSPRSEPHVTT